MDALIAANFFFMRGVVAVCKILADRSLGLNEGSKRIAGQIRPRILMSCSPFQFWFNGAVNECYGTSCYALMPSMRLDADGSI